MPHDASWLIKLQRHFCLGIKDYFKHHLPGSLVTKGILCQLISADRRVAMTILLSWLESKCHRWRNHLQYLTPEQSGIALPAPCSLPLLLLNLPWLPTPLPLKCISPAGRALKVIGSSGFMVSLLSQNMLLMLECIQVFWGHVDWPLSL